MSLIATLVLALLKAVPALEGIFKNALEMLDQGRAASALARKNAKDAAVDAAINLPEATSENNDHTSAEKTTAPSPPSLP